MMKLPKIYSLGNKYTEHVLDNEVEITGKYDGSQFRIYKPSENALVFGSRSVDYSQHPTGQKQFQPAIDYAMKYEKEILDAVPVGTTIFAEYVGSMNKHRIKYPTTRELMVFLFYFDGKWFPPTWADLPFDKVTQLYYGKTDIAGCLDLMQQIDPKRDLLEGIVIKNYHLDPSKQTTWVEPFAKLVHPDFREIKSTQFPLDDPETKNEAAFLDFALTRTRVEKMMWYLRDSDPEYEPTMKMMPKLIPLVMDDILREELIDWLYRKKPKAFHFYEFKRAVGGQVAHYLKHIIYDWMKEENK